MPKVPPLSLKPAPAPALPPMSTARRPRFHSDQFQPDRAFNMYSSVLISSYTRTSETHGHDLSRSMQFVLDADLCRAAPSLGVLLEQPP